MTMDTNSYICFGSLLSLIFVQAVLHNELISRWQYIVCSIVYICYL